MATTTMPKPSEPEAAENTVVSSANGRDSFVDDYLLYLLARASSQASAQFHNIVKARGLTVADWRVLGMLSSGPATIGELVVASLFQQPTLTKIVDRMAGSGFVRRTTDPKDGRRVQVSLTATGRALADELVPLAKEHEQMVLGAYTPEEARALKTALKTLIERTK